jgi:Restriction endonuclease.
MGKNKIKGTRLEKEYEWLWELGINKDCIITSPMYYNDLETGESRETDVFIEELNEEGEITASVMVECRNRNQVQDVRWVEEVIGKRQSLNPARVIMVSTSEFTKPARDKAKMNGIEVERSSSLDELFIEKQKQELESQARFICMECIGITIYTTKGVFNHFQISGRVIQSYVRNQINRFSESEYFVEELNKHCIPESFFDSDANYLSIDFALEPQVIKENALSGIFVNDFGDYGKIFRISFTLHITPKTFKFPLSRVITIFDDDVEKINSNKRHKSLYENGRIAVCFQIHKEKMHYEMTLKKINKYWRFFGGQSTLYALLENVDNEKSGFAINNHPRDLLGEIYFGSLMK